MTTIVRYDCGCIGTMVDSTSTAAILVACDADDGGPGSSHRPVGSKEYEPIDYRQEIHAAFVAQHKYRQLQAALRVALE